MITSETTLGELGEILASEEIKKLSVRKVGLAIDVCTDGIGIWFSGRTVAEALDSAIRNRKESGAQNHD